MNIKNLGLCLISLLAFSTAASALTTTMTVTTLVDENGENDDACSLREAVRAVKDKKAFGGCPAGDALRGNLIQLGAGHYDLTLGQLLLEVPLTIAGKDTLQPDVENSYTGKKPNRLRPDDAVNGTFIDGRAGSRLILTTAALSLRDMVLQADNSVAVPLTDNNGNGGVLYNADALSLENVIVRNGRVSGSGAGIFMAGTGSSLSISDSTFDTNVAARQGGAIAMACAEGLNPYAAHVASITRSLFVNNASATGAAAVEVCGSTTLAVSASTFSGNNSAASSVTNAASPSAAIAYQLPAGAPNTLGTVNLSYITAVGNDEFLAVSGIATLALSGSFIAFNGSGGGCVAAVGVVLPVTRTGIFNATDDADCIALMTASASNLVVTGTTLSAELTTLGDHGGLTDTYLPGTASLFVKDTGDTFASCTSNDQRNLPRHSGGTSAATKKCDMGAVERLQPTANDDEADTAIETDRAAIVDVLANDTFGESDTAPYHFIPASVVVDSVVGAPAVPEVLPDPSIPGDTGQPARDGATCVWHTVDDPVEEYRNRLVIKNDGVLTSDAAPVVCTYHIVDSNPVVPAVFATATVSVNVKNAAPNAKADVYVRAQGTPSITFDPMRNDDDDNDGIYGQADPVWADYPIFISMQPGLGSVTGAASSRCPDWTSTNLKVCYKPPLTYTADNSQAPFADSFTYAVYDHAGKMSNDAVITIASDAPDPDKGQTGGSIDLLGGLVLALLGLRRTRKL